MDGATAYTLIAIALLIGTPFFIVFGALSDKIGRLKIILFGCLIAALTYFPLFKALTHYVNPALEAYQVATPITVAANPADCELHIFVGPWSKFSDCDKAKDYLTKAGLSFTSGRLPAGSTRQGRHDDRQDSSSRASDDKDVRSCDEGERATRPRPTTRRSTSRWCC